MSGLRKSSSKNSEPKNSLDSLPLKQSLLKKIEELKTLIQEL